MSKTIKNTTDEKKGILSKILAVLGILGSSVFLLNLTLGIFEVPDNLPFVGNLDEVVVSAFLLSCFRFLGYDILPFKKQIVNKNKSQ